MDSVAVSEVRRSPRLLVSHLVSLSSGEDQTWARTAVVNRHGALVLSAQEFDRARILEMSDRKTGARADCRVVWSGGLTADGYKIGIEFLQEQPHYWGDDYNADNDADNETPAPR